MDNTMRFACPLFFLCLEAYSICAETDGLDKLGLKTLHADPATEEVVARMTDLNASFKNRCAAEDELAKLPPQQVLPALLPYLAKGMPKDPIHNSSGREMDRNAPIPWQIYYAVARAWGEQIDGLPRKDGGKVLLALLKEVATDKERIPVLYALANRWDPAAEPELARLLGDANASRDVQLYAALPLIIHGKNDYRDVMLQCT